MLRVGALILAVSLWSSVSAAQDIVQAPTKIRHVDPIYPAGVANQAGFVIAELSLNVTGDVADVRLLRGATTASFDEATLAALRQWRFTPMRRSGVAVPSSYLVLVMFEPSTMSAEEQRQKRFEAAAESTRVAATRNQATAEAVIIITTL